jgi:Response regulator receiver domain
MSKHILIVDDSDTFRKITRLFLESQLDLEVCGEAVDGMDAIEKARALKPDLVVLDLAMPRMMPECRSFYSRCTTTPWAARRHYPRVRAKWFPSLAVDGSFLSAFEVCFRPPDLGKHRLACLHLPTRPHISCARSRPFLPCLSLRRRVMGIEALRAPTPRWLPGFKATHERRSAWPERPARRGRKEI